MSLRVEASYRARRTPNFVGQEYPLTWLSRQPLLDEAVTTGSIVLGGSFGDAVSPTRISRRHCR